jgi:CO/xanthine dehydrogenase FAD-binding subunit
MASFFAGYRQTAARPDELIVNFEIAPVRGRQWFRKVGPRAAQAIAKVVVAGVWHKSRAGARPRLAMGSVAPIPLRLPRTEEALGSGASVAEAQAILQREIAPIDDLRSTEAYRRQVAANLVGQFCAECRPLSRPIMAG